MRKEMKRLLAILLTAVLISGHVFTALASSGELTADTGVAQEATTKEAKEAAETTTEQAEAVSEATTEKKTETTEATTEQPKETEEATTEQEKDTIETTTEQAAKTTEQPDETSATTAEQSKEAGETTTAQAEKTNESTTEQSGETAQATTEQSEETKSTETSKEEDTSSVEEAQTVEEETKLVMNYEDDDVEINVVEVDKDAIPENASLKVVPILQDDKETEAQFKEVKEKLEEKAADDETEIAGFLAYDISFVDVNGNEVEPSGKVQVTMEYKKAAMPEEAKDVVTDVTVMHLEEDKNGNVAKVVDMGKNEQLKAIETTDANKVQKAEFVTESFSVYTVTWNTGSIKIQYVDEDGNDISLSGGDRTVTFENNTSAVDLNSSDYKLEIPGYTFVRATAASYTNTFSIDRIQVDRRTIKYRRTDTNTLEEWEVSYRYVYMIYKKTGSTGEEESPAISLGEPNHNKKIRKNDTEDYTLYLDVDGKQGSATPIDILLIVDKSGSMNSTMVNNVNNAISLLKNQLKSAETEINIATVTFSGTKQVEDDIYEDAWIAEGWTGINSSTFKLSDCTGGTNWQAGIRTGERTFANRPTSNRRYVLFLTDGSPTFYYQDNSDVITAGAGNDNYENNFVEPYSKATSEWNSTTYLKSATSYVIDATSGSSKNSYCVSLANLMSGKTDGSTCLKGSDNTSLTNSFTAIANSILKPAYTNVYIKDTLSEHVDFAEELNFKIVKITENADGSKTTEDITNTNDHKVTTDGKIIRVDLLNGGQLPDGVTYQIQFDVKTTKEAYFDYFQNGGYSGVVGDQGTDAEGNTTSSGQPGFHSNSSAVVGYSENGSNPTEAPYKHPVIQVELADLITTHTVNKRWVGTLADKVSVTLVPQVVLGDDGKYEKLSDEQIAAYKAFPKDDSGNVNMTIDLNADMNWTYQWENLPKYYYYYNEETKTIEKTELKYTVNENLTEEEKQKYNVKIEDNENGLETVVTNSYIAKKDISFQKMWDDFNNAYDTRPDELKVTLTGKVGDEVVATYDATVTADGNWSHTWEDVPIYYYDENGKKTKITWSVSEDDITGYEQDYNGSDADSTENVLDKAAIPSPTVKYETASSIPANPNDSTESSTESETQTASTYSLRTASNSTEEEENTEEVTTYAEGSVSSTYAGRPGSGSSSSSTFNHLDIEAAGSYSFNFDGETYTVTFDFKEGTWTCINSQGGTESSGTLSVTDMVITQKDTDNDDSSFDEKNITASGSWQTSNIAGQESEYRISGTFDRGDTFEFYFELPVKITDDNGNVIASITLISNFETSYSDTVYNVCPDGGGKGIDIELDSAIDEAIRYNVLGLTKTFEGLDGADVPETTFTIKSEDGTYDKTLTYSDFANGYSGSTSLNSLPAGKYTITENVGEAEEGYTATGTIVTVVGERSETEEASEDGKSVTFEIEAGTVVSVSFVNTYTNAPQEHVITMEKIWVDNKETHPDVTLEATLSNGETWTETLSDSNWTASQTVAADVTITNIEETKTLEGYTTTTTISSTGTSAVVINKASSLTSTTATVNKVWEDQYDKYGKRTDEIQVVLYQQKVVNGEESGEKTVYATATLTEAGNWSYTFVDLPTTEVDGSETTAYKYFVEEINVPSGYSSSGMVEITDGAATITNTLNTEELDESFYIVNEIQTQLVTINKYWNDDNNKYNGRPDSLTLNLLYNNGVMQSTTLSNGHDNANHWSVTYTVPATYDSTKFSVSETFPSAFGEANYYNDKYDTYLTKDKLSIVNTPKITSITVTKIWNDAQDAYGKRPTQITFKLQYKYTSQAEDAWKTYEFDYDGDGTIEDIDGKNGTFTMIGAECEDSDQKNYWYYTVDGLPVSDENGDYEYRIVEKDVPDGYKSTMDGVSTIINTFETQIIKRSSSGDGTNNPTLQGAVFEVKLNENTVYYGQSGNDGIISWYKSYSAGNGVSEVMEKLPDGTYTLKEIVAPQGYMVSQETWTITSDKGIITVTDETEDKSIKSDQNSETAIAEIYFDNEPLYELPSSGRGGIYWYLISGMLMMMAAALIIYKNKCREVQRG